MLYVHLRDSLSNPKTPLFALVKALVAETARANETVVTAADELIAQAGAADPTDVRLVVKENRKLSPQEVEELITAYRTGATQVELAERFGMHEQTVRAHLKRGGVKLRPTKVLEGVLGDEAVRLYVEERLSLAKVGHRLGVSADAVRRKLMKLGIERRDRC